MLESSDNYSMTSGSFSNYYRHEINDDANENAINSNGINNNKAVTSKCFEYKTKLGKCRKWNNKKSKNIHWLFTSN